jgi:hypothetical protein
MADPSPLLALSDLSLTHDGYPLGAPPWAVAPQAWAAVLPAMQALRRQAGDFEPVRLPDVSAWFERTCGRCGAGFLSRVASGRYCSNRCDPRAGPRAPGAAADPAPAADAPRVVRRRRPADAVPVRCEHCLAPASAPRSPGRWFCSIRCMRQARAAQPAVSRDA